MLITRNNYEEFFLLYVDGELSAGDKLAVEKFTAANPDLLEELNLLKETVFVADSKIIFEHKEELYKEEEKKVIGFYWWRVAAAVILLFGAGTWGWIYLNNKETSTPKIATTSPVKVLPPVPTDVKKETDVIEEPSEPVVSTPPAARQEFRVNTPIQPGIKKENTPAKEEIKLNLPTDLTATSVEPPIEDVDITVVPQKLNNEQLDQVENKTGNKTLAYEYVQPSEDDMIYVANTSVSKRNKLRGVFRKATRILDRVTSTN